MQAISYKKWLNLAQKSCKESGVELTAPLILLEFVTGNSKAKILSFDETILSDNELDTLYALLARRLNNEPLAYILGKKEFFGRDFIVNSNVLIPRPESEMLIEEAILHYNKVKQNEYKMCDIGTGSGCLAISSVLEIPQATCVAIDISEEAIQVAKENAKLNNADALTFLQLDINDENLVNSIISGNFNCIISNPPYIPDEEYINLEKNVLDYEPKHALTSGITGLEVIQSVLLFASKYLANNGILLIEHGYNQNNLVLAMAHTILGNEFKCESLKDYAGNWRILKAEKSF